MPSKPSFQLQANLNDPFVAPVIGARFDTLKYEIHVRLLQIPTKGVMWWAYLVGYESIQVYLQDRFFPYSFWSEGRCSLIGCRGTHGNKDMKLMNT
jgi:hypothetical protein